DYKDIQADIKKEQAEIDMKIDALEKEKAEKIQDIKKQQTDWENKVEQNLIKAQAKEILEQKENEYKSLLNQQKKKSVQENDDIEKKRPAGITNQNWSRSKQAYNYLKNKDKDFIND